MNRRILVENTPWQFLAIAGKAARLSFWPAFAHSFFLARYGRLLLDRLLRRLSRHKDALLRVLDRPEIPLNTNASENDIRAFVTKRKISGGTISLKGRDALYIMLGLAKTCMKLNLSFYDFLGARLGIQAPQIPPLPELIRPAPS